MKKLLTGLAASVLLTPLVYADDFCKEIESALQINIGSELPAAMDVGVSHNFSIQFTITNPDIFKGMNIAIWHNFVNGIQGSSSLSFAADLDSEALALLEPGAVHTVADRMTIPRNMIGKYKFWTGVMARTADGKRCDTYKFPMQNPREFEVVNDPATADIQPPVVTKIEISKNAVSRGEKIYLKFFVEDKNTICTLPFAIEGKCSGVWHVAFVQKGGEEELNDFQPIVLHPDGHYLVEVTIPADAVPGTYTLEILDVGDIFDNLAAQIDPSLALELIVK